MDIILLFVLAHLIGDFVFQTNKIAVLKMNSNIGLLIHSLIITVVGMALLSVFGVYGIAIGLILGMFHYVIDYMKTKIQRYLQKKEFLYFLLDQILHMIVIALIVKVFISMDINIALGNSWFLSTIDLEADVFNKGVRFIIGIILITYVSTVSVKMILRDMFIDIKNSDFFLIGERIIDAITGMLLALCIFFLNIYGVMLFIVLFFFYSYIQKRLFKYTQKIILIKYMFILIISILVSSGCC